MSLLSGDSFHSSGSLLSGDSLVLGGSLLSSGSLPSGGSLLLGVRYFRGVRYVRNITVVFTDQFVSFCNSITVTITFMHYILSKTVYYLNYPFIGEYSF